MTQFQEQKRFSARPSKSYWIQASDEEDEEFIEAAYIPFEQDTSISGTFTEVKIMIH